MNITRITTATAACAVALLTLAGCASNESQPAGGTSTAGSSDAPATLSGQLNGAGASTQTVAQQSWATLFQTANPDATVNYNPVGSGSGREQFQQGAVPLAGTDDPFDTDTIKSGPFSSCADGSAIVEIPAYVSPVAITFNLKGITTLNLDPATIAGIFAGTITSWNDPAIAALNKDATLPSTKISPVHRSDKSGTTGNFTEYLDATAKDVWTYGQVEEWPINGGEAAKGTAGVVSAIQAGEGTIGYADASQVTGSMGTAAVKVGDAFVAPSADAAAVAMGASPMAEGRGETDLAVKIDRTTTAAGAYPVILSSYVVACQKYADADTAALVKGYLTTVLSDEGQAAAAKDAGSAPLPKELQQKAQAVVETIAGS